MILELSFLTLTCKNTLQLLTYPKSDADNEDSDEDEDRVGDKKTVTKNNLILKTVTGATDC